VILPGLAFFALFCIYEGLEIVCQDTFSSDGGRIYRRGGAVVSGYVQDPRERFYKTRSSGSRM